GKQPLALAPLLFELFLIGDITGDTDEPDHLALRVSVRRLDGRKSPRFSLERDDCLKSMLCSASQHLLVILHEPLRPFWRKQFPVVFSDNLFHRFADGSCAGCVDELISAFCVLHKDRVGGGVDNSAQKTLWF